jgi:hypothetical protein
MSRYDIEHESCQLLWALSACASEESRISGSDAVKITGRFWDFWSRTRTIANLPENSKRCWGEG